MDKTALINVDLSRGAEVLNILDRAKIKPSVALWAHLSEYEDWRLVISARELDQVDLRSAYLLLNESLNAGGIGPETEPIIMILRLKDPFIKALRRRFAKNKNVEGLRLAMQEFGDRLIEDAFVYRIS